MVQFGVVRRCIVRCVAVQSGAVKFNVENSLKVFKCDVARLDMELGCFPYSNPPEDWEALLAR